MEIDCVCYLTLDSWQPLISDTCCLCWCLIAFGICQPIVLSWFSVFYAIYHGIIICSQHQMTTTWWECVWKKSHKHGGIGLALHLWKVFQWEHGGDDRGGFSHLPAVLNALALSGLTQSSVAYWGEGGFLKGFSRRRNSCIIWRELHLCGT